MTHAKLLVCEILARWPELTVEDLGAREVDRNRLSELLASRYGFCPRRADVEAKSALSDFAERLHRATAA